MAANTSTQRYNPALFSKSIGHSSTLPLPRHQISNSIQINHLASHPTSLRPYISKEFVKGIELQNRPAADYYSKMKQIYRDELDMELQAHQKKQQRLKTEQEDFRREYRQNKQGLLHYLEKEENTRADNFRRTLKIQQLRGNRFVDAQKIRDQRIDELIDAGNDPARMYRFQEAYENQNNLSQLSSKSPSHRNKMVSYEQEEGKVINNLKSIRGNIRQGSSIGPLNNLDQNSSLYQRQQNDGNKIRQSEHSDLNALEVVKNPRHTSENTSPKKALQSYRLHNPLYNPIQYHVENPYFLSRMQQKYFH